MFQSDFGKGLSLEPSLKLTALVFARKLKTSIYILVSKLGYYWGRGGGESPVRGHSLIHRGKMSQIIRSVLVSSSH